MNTPLRAALAALTGATMLLVASCTSTSESATPSTGSATASAWVKPVESASGSASPTSAARGGSDLSSTLSSQSSQETWSDPGSDPNFSAAPLPAELSDEDRRQAKAALEAYADYWTVTRLATSDPSVDWTGQISEVATGTAAKNLANSVNRYQEQNYRVEGQAVVVVSVQKIEAGAVELRLCVDGSQGRLVDATGAPINEDVDTVTRRPGSARVGEYTSGWKVDTNVYDMNSSC